MSDVPSTSKATFENDTDDLFYFESDHLALKGNKDYSEILKTISILEAQKARAISDIDCIVDIQKTALENPEKFLLKLKNKEDLCVPKLQNIAEIPVINWSKYKVDIPEEAFKLLNYDKANENNENHLFKVPKRRKSDDFRSTFKKPWSSAEQKKLEELLIRFPPEAVEMRRYKKIAEALGNRTVKQVTSRLQKYFVKLYKAGLPIPGRIPKTIDKKRAFSHKHQRHNYLLYKPTTFFPDMEVPVHMPENDEDMPGPDVPPPSDSSGTSNSSNSEEKSEIQLKIELLQRIKVEKEKEQYTSAYVHTGCKCDVCKEEPLTGCRWHCYSCTQESIDFCNDCIVVQLMSSNCHPLSHTLVAIQADNTPVLSSASTRANSPVVLSTNSSQEMKEGSSSDMDSSTSGTETDASTDNESEESDSSEEGTPAYELDSDYLSHNYGKDSGKYNYLDSNFLPK